MPKFFIEQNQVNNDVLEIIGDDFLHMTKSLRVKINEKIVACDGDFDYNCIIESISTQSVTCKILQKEQTFGEPSVKVYVYISATKGDKLELVTQKVTELGAYEIIPFLSARCVSKPDAKSSAKKTERLQKIATEAAKQCARSKIPTVSNFLTVKQITERVKEHDLNLVLYENEKDLDIKTVLQRENFKSISIVIGPEGGFEPSEIDNFIKNNFEIVSLGKRILRAETAPIAALSAIMYETDNFS